MQKKTADRPACRPRHYKPFIPWREGPHWRPPAGYVPYLLRLPALQGRHYGARVVVAQETCLRDWYLPGLVGRIAHECHREWERVGDNEVLVQFGARGIVRFPRDHLRLDQL